MFCYFTPTSILPIRNIYHPAFCSWTKDTRRCGSATPALRLPALYRLFGLDRKKTPLPGFRRYCTTTAGNVAYGFVTLAQHRYFALTFMPFTKGRVYDSAVLNTSIMPGEHPTMFSGHFADGPL